MTYKYRIVELKKRVIGYNWSDAFLEWMKNNHPLVNIPEYNARLDDEHGSIRDHMKLFNEANPGIMNVQDRTVPGLYYILQRKQLFWWVWTGMQSDNVTALWKDITFVVQKSKEKFEDNLHHRVVEEFNLEVKIDKTTRY